MRAAKQDCRPVGDEALWPASRVLEFFSVKKSVFYELAAEPDFPTKIVLGKRCVRWKASEIRAYAERRRVSREPDGRR